MSFLISCWLKGESPIVNGVMFADDFVDVVEPFEQPHSVGLTYVNVKERTSLNAFASLDTTHLITCCRIEDTANMVIAVGGEGGMGGDGFVAVLDLLGQLQWMAFFDFSNPFTSVDVVHGEIIGSNNLGEFWYFPLKNPSKIRVIVPLDFSR